VSLRDLRKRCAALALVLGMSTSAPPSVAQGWQSSTAGEPNATPRELAGVDVVERLGGALPGGAKFTDADGRLVRLGGLFDGKRPSVLVFAYHTCPMLCSLVLDATVRALSAIPWTVGNQFDLVSISIDPHDTTETAARKRDDLLSRYPRSDGKTSGWHFLVGDEANIRSVTEAVGFQFRYDERQKQFAHPAAIYILSPDGRIERYLYGIQFAPNDVRLGLLEAAESRSITTTEKLLLYCYHYDPQGKRYSLAAMNLMRLGGIVTVVVLGGFVMRMLVRERRKRSRILLKAASVQGGAR